MQAAADHKILYASTYQRERSACCMAGGGPGSGIWKSIDGGDTWTRFSGNGLPTGNYGRIGLTDPGREGDLVHPGCDLRLPPNVRGIADDPAPSRSGVSEFQRT